MFQRKTRKFGLAPFLAEELRLECTAVEQLLLATRDDVKIYTRLCHRSTVDDLTHTPNRLTIQKRGLINLIV